MTTLKTSDEIERFINETNFMDFTYQNVLECYKDYIKHEKKLESQILHSNRRCRVVWTEELLDILRKSIKKHGVSRWKKIYNENKEIFDEHNINSADLKVKYNTLKSLSYWSNL